MVLLSSACHLHQTITTLSLIVFSISELCQNTSIVCAIFQGSDFLQILLSKELDKGKTAKDLTGIKYVPPSRP